jgi:hypothetical protein
MNWIIVRGLLFKSKQKATEVTVAFCLPVNETAPKHECRHFSSLASASLINYTGIKKETAQSGGIAF